MLKTPSKSADVRNVNADDDNSKPRIRIIVNADVLGFELSSTPLRCAFRITHATFMRRRRVAIYTTPQVIRWKAPP